MEPRRSRLKLGTMANLQGFFQVRFSSRPTYFFTSEVMQEFNGSKFVLFCSLLMFSVLYTLKLDGVISWSWWSVFLPLWVWKGIAISGASVGSYVWWRRPQSRLNNEEYLQYKAMLISLAVHLLLLMFELLTADNLDTRRHKVGRMLGRK